MTYELARDKVAAIVAATTPTTVGENLGAKFAEAPDADEDSPPGARRFTMRALADDVRVPLSGRKKRVAAMELTVWYPRLRRNKALDRILREDHKAIGDRLLQPALWDSATTGLLSIEQNGGTLILHADVVVSGDDVRHVYRFDLEYFS